MSAKERWLLVEGSRRYEVSDLGRVRGVRSGKVLKTARDRGGYVKVSLYREWKVKRTVSVHRLVALAFLPRCPSGLRTQVAHIDGDQLNNDVSNLKWATAKENCDDRRTHGTHCCGERMGRAKLTSECVLEARAIYSAGGMYYHQLATRYGVAYTTIRMAVSRKAWRHLP
jgi:hypothetical protein